jgi:hypothetical protein
MLLKLQSQESKKFGREEMARTPGRKTWLDLEQGQHHLITKGKDLHRSRSDDLLTGSSPKQRCEANETARAKLFCSHQSTLVSHQQPSGSRSDKQDFSRYQTRRAEAIPQIEAPRLKLLLKSGLTVSGKTLESGAEGPRRLGVWIAEIHVEEAAAFEICFCASSSGD